LTSATHKDANRPQAVRAPAIGHRRLGQPHEALAACQAGLARYPDDAELLYVMGDVYRDRGNPSGAELWAASAPPAIRWPAWKNEINEYEETEGAAESLCFFLFHFLHLISENLCPALLN